MIVLGKTPEPDAALKILTPWWDVLLRYLTGGMYIITSDINDDGGDDDDEDGDDDSGGDEVCSDIGNDNGGRSDGKHHISDSAHVSNDDNHINDGDDSGNIGADDNDVYDYGDRKDDNVYIK